MTRLLAVDPGVHASGWALLAGSGPPALVACGLHRVDPSLFDEWPVSIDVLAIEVPQVYRAGRSRGDPSDLVDLAIAAGRAIEAVGAGEVRRLRPAEWKGQTPKAICHRRARALLGPDELGRLELCLAPVARPLRHNVLDAVALGLWASGRRTR